MHPGERGQNAGCLLAGGQIGAFAKIKFLAHPDDVFDARTQANSDEIGVAGLNDRAPEIILARRRQIPDVPPADINVTRTVNEGVRVQSVFECGEADDGFKN